MKPQPPSFEPPLQSFSVLPPKKRVWRIGLLSISIILGAWLISFGILEHQAAQKNALRFTQGQVMFMMMGFQQQLRRKKVPPAQLTESLYDMLKEKGVTYVALHDNGHIRFEFGRHQKAINPAAFATPSPQNPIEVRFTENNLAHAQILLPPPHRRGHRRFADSPKGNLRPADTRVYLEFLPQDAIALKQRASRIMGLNILSAVILIIAAIFFWRQSTHQDFLQAQLSKDQQLKMLGQMSAVLGHELKNSIASVKGHAQLLEEKLTGTEHSSNISLVVQDSVYLQKLTEQMLDFARTGILKQEKVYIDDLAESAIALSNLTEDETKNVSIHIDAKAPTCILDRQKIQQVISNLLNNAIDADATKIELSFRLQNDSLRIRITDNGNGISAKQQARIFDPFFTTKAKGTGLGLAFAARVMTQHNGSIEVESFPKSSTVFTIQIPQATHKNV